MSRIQKSGWARYILLSTARYSLLADSFLMADQLYFLRDLLSLNSNPKRSRPSSCCPFLAATAIKNKPRCRGLVFLLGSGLRFVRFFYAAHAALFAEKLCFSDSDSSVRRRRGREQASVVFGFDRWEIVEDTVGVTY